MTSRDVRSLHPVLLVLVAPLAASWCAPITTASQAAQARITGSATYRERVALTPTAVFEASLEDVSHSDAATEVIARARKENPGQVPIAFEIPYDTRRIDKAGRYLVRANIYVDGRLRFTNSQAYPVLTHGHGKKVAILMRNTGADERAPEAGGDLGGLDPTTFPATFAGLLPCGDCAGIRYQVNLLPGGAYMQHVTYLRDHDHGFYELGTWWLSRDGGTLTLEGGPEGDTYWAVKSPTTLQKLDRTGKPIDSKLPCELRRRASVESIEPRGQLQGMFRYMADAPRFRDCRSGLEWPVAMSDEYQGLERAYTAQRLAPGSTLLVSLDGRIEQRPKMEGGGTEPTLVVERFVRAMPGEPCRERTPQAGLASTRWRPIRIGDRTVTISGEQREPWIVLEPRTKRVTGSGGCNRISGSYEAGQGTLHFGRLLSTHMACPLMDIETAFLRALGDTRRYRVRGRILELLDEHDRLLVRLEDQNPR